MNKKNKNQLWLLVLMVAIAIGTVTGFIKNHFIISILLGLGLGLLMGIVNTKRFRKTKKE